MPTSALRPLLLLTLLAGIPAAHGDGLIVIDRPPPGWRPQPHLPHAFAPLEVRRHHVTVSIDGQVAVTEVDQTFFNPGAQQLEGTYLFPVPKGAKIDSFAMEIDGKMTEAELLDAAKARKIYEGIVRSMKDPALLEYAGQDLFKVRIFPLEPGKEKRVKLRYTQLLTADGGLLGLSVDEAEGLTVRGNRFYANGEGLPDADWMGPGNTLAPYAEAAERENWPDPDRTLKRYVTEELGLTLLDWSDDPWLPPDEVAPRVDAGEAYDPAGLKTFMAVATNMRRGGVDTIPASGKPSWTGDYPWDARFTGRAVVDWIRAAFGLPPTRNGSD